MKRSIVIGALSAGLASGLCSGSDYYVDSQAAPDGIGTQASPFATIPAALAAASANSTIWVRGGEGRAYGVTNSTDTLQIPPGMDGLSICAYETTPGDGGRADVILSDTYIGSDTYVADKARFHIISNAASFVTVSGLAFSFGPNLVENASSFPSGQTTAFVSPSCIQANAWLSDAFNGGTATQVSGYDLSPFLVDNIALVAPLEFVCTNDIYNADFYRVRCHPGDPDLKRLGWRGPDGLQPRFIGALEPIVSCSFTIYYGNTTWNT